MIKPMLFYSGTDVFYPVRIHEFLMPGVELDGFLLCLFFP